MTASTNLRIYLTLASASLSASYSEVQVGGCEKKKLTPGITRVWNSTWRCLVQSSFANKRRASQRQTRRRNARSTHIPLDILTMPSDLPYAADAEESLTYDELNVGLSHSLFSSESKADSNPVPCSAQFECNRFCDCNSRRNTSKGMLLSRRSLTMRGGW